jgi:hypothetical protein
MLLGGAVGDADRQRSRTRCHLGDRTRRKMLLRFALIQNWSSRGENTHVPG